MTSRTVMLWVLFLVFALLCSTELVGEKPAGVRGKVVDTIEHAPIRNAYVLAHRDGSMDKTTRTDGTGSYSIELPPGIYDVFISASAFSPACRKIDVQPDGMMIFDAVLGAADVGLEQ